MNEETGRKAIDTMTRRILDHGQAQAKAGVAPPVDPNTAKRLATEAAVRADRREESKRR